MNLFTGDLSSIEGAMLLMTATASSSTVRILKSQFPEIKGWHMIMNAPLRDNVTLVIPPRDIISGDLETSLAPFIEDIKDGKTYLVIVRGIMEIPFFLFTAF